jgi:hypothetical protein
MFRASYMELGTIFPPEQCSSDNPFQVSDDPYDDPDVRRRIGELIARYASAKHDDRRLGNKTEGSA